MEAAPKDHTDESWFDPDITISMAFHKLSLLLILLIANGPPIETSQLITL